MKKNTCRLLGIMAAMILVSGQVWAAQIISKVEDASVALRIYNGYDSTLTWVVTDAGGTNTITAGGLAGQTIINSGSGTNDTIALMATSAKALTNAAGTASLTVDQDPSLAADSVDSELLDGTYTAAAGEWLELLWDTSAHLSFDLYFPDRDVQTGVSAYIIDKVYGLPGGTGNLTLSIYKNRVLIDQRFITSPAYVLPETLVFNSGDGTNTLGTVNAINLDVNLNLPLTGKDPVIIRAARGTTATTGVISATIPNR